MATNPRQIEAFRAVMTRQTVTSAAEALGISQPAVSRLIRDLELHSGVQLFARQGRQLIPTDAAQLLHAEVERIDLGMRRLEQFLADLRQRRRGDLRIAALPSMATEFLPRFLAGTADRLRPTRLYLDGLPSRLVRDAVESGQAEIGFAIMPTRKAGLSVERISASCVMVLPRGHRLAGRGMITAAEIRGEQLVYLASRSVFDSSLRGEMRDNIDASPIRTPLSMAACNLVAAGAGIALVDPFSASCFLERGLQTIPFRPRVDAAVSIITAESRPLSGAGRIFLDLARAHISATLDKLGSK